MFLDAPYIELEFVLITFAEELPDSWNEEPNMQSFKSFDRHFVFPGKSSCSVLFFKIVFGMKFRLSSCKGNFLILRKCYIFFFSGEQVHILACLSACKQDTEVITPFKVAAMMSKTGIGRSAKKQNGEVTHGSSPVSAVASSPDANEIDDNGNDKTDPKKDVSTGESLLRMEDHRRQTEMLLQRFRNSHFFARIAEADEPLWSKRKTQETFRESTEMIGGKLGAYDDKKILPADKENPDASTSGGVARNGFKCSSLANGDIVVCF